ncbi:MAG: transporter, partial [Comamonadaceae bacterium]
MSTGIFLAILLAALMNAAWNSAIKIGGDKIVVMTMTTLVGSVISLCALPFVGVFAST